MAISTKVRRNPSVHIFGSPKRARDQNYIYSEVNHPLFTCNLYFWVNKFKGKCEILKSKLFCHNYPSRKWVHSSRR